ncbi:MAG TPA: transcriptional repressor LexA [Spirochaetota bacterium]|nr:transcriptional repressor LexA [Spirochaetota bacterium]HPI90828.1 transcriptional repressor LexA [Spirochaetota bacterium]HPR47623.1 transcriptional repressor LexA [Spirochaetota bacterium]
MAENERKLTEKQDLIYQFIKDKIKESGFPPTVREIGDEFSITVKGAYDHIKAIEKKGYIKTEQNKSRAIVVTGSGQIDAPSITIPLIGRIAAGSPILAQENIDDYLSFPQGSFSKGEFFALEVKGDSMIDSGIFNGDVAIIKKQNTANNGDIIAALINEEATLKRYKNEKGKIELIAENKAYKPIIPDNLIILGKLSAVFRTY